MLNIEFFLSTGVCWVYSMAVGDCCDSVLFQIERMGMCRLQRSTEMG